MRVSRIINLMALSGLLISCSGAVSADPLNWYAAATACTPYHDAIAQNLYSNANGRVRFKPGKTGTIWLACNLPGPLKPSETNKLFLSITYQVASNDRLTNVAASAELKAVSKINGQISNLQSVGLIVGSQPTWFGSDVLTRSAQLPTGTKFDFTKNYYYVIITVKRSSIQFEPTVFGVAITDRRIHINEE